MGITSSKPTNSNGNNGINGGGIVGSGSNVNLNSPSSLKTMVDRKPHTKQKRNKSRNLSTDSKSSSCSSPTNNYLTEELVMDLNSLEIDATTGTSATTVFDMRTSIGEKQIQQKQQQLLQQHILQQQLLQQQAQVTSPIQQHTHQQHENTILDQDDGEFNNNFESESEVESISSSSVQNNNNSSNNNNNKSKNKVKQVTTGNKIQNGNKNNSSNDLKSKYSYEDGSTSKSNSTLSLYSNISNIHSIQDANIVCENCNHHMTKPIHLLSLSMEPTSASSLDIHRNGNFSITLASNSRSSSPATILQHHHHQQPPQILNSNGKFFLVNSSANIINTSLNSNNNNINNNSNINNNKDNCSSDNNNSNNDIPDPSWSNYNNDSFNNSNNNINNSNNNNNVFNAFLQSPFLQTMQQQERREEVTSPLIQEITSPSLSPPTVLTQELPSKPQQQSQQTSPPQFPYQQLLQNNNNSNSNNNNSNLASSMGSTSELFNKSLISSFLNNQGINSSSATNPFENSYKNNMNNSTNSGTNTAAATTTTIANNNNNNNNNLKSFLSNSNSSFSALKDLSYEAKDMTFSITLSNSELNSMIADSLNRSSASNSIVKSNNVSNGNSSDGYGMVSHQSTTTSTPTQQSSSHHHLHHHNNNSNNSNKDITFLVSDNPDSIKEKSNVSNTSSIISASNLNRHHTPNSSTSMSARPRGRSISESLFMSPSNKESLNDIQRAIESEKIKKTKFEELKSILGEREDIIDINDIQFVQKVGEGAFSEVWEGWWKGIHVAIKKLKIIGDEEQFKERFIREVQNLKKGNHANIVMFIGACYKPACIITEYMAGGSLYNILHNPNNTQKVKYSFPLVLKMATDMALGLLHLHSITIVHRDLTSQNILLDELGNIKITDFGLSREKSREGSMTMTNGGICNPRWRPPELTKNLGHYSEKVDVYCFSLVVWEILTGEIPFSELDGSQASAQVAYAGLRPPIPEFCDPELKALLVQCWSDDPNERPHFTFIVDKLKEISWLNPIGFVPNDQFYQYPSEPSTPRSNISLSPTTTTNNNK